MARGRRADLGREWEEHAASQGLLGNAWGSAPRTSRTLDYSPRKPTFASGAEWHGDKVTTTHDRHSMRQRHLVATLYGFGGAGNHLAIALATACQPVSTDDDM
jgi:hypothetical protein